MIMTTITITIVIITTTIIMMRHRIHGVTLSLPSTEIQKWRFGIENHQLVDNQS